VVHWGADFVGVARIPATLTNTVAISGGVHALALKEDGTPVAWGENRFGQGEVPPGLSNVVSVSAGIWHSMILLADGTVVAWGSNEFGQSEVPPGLSNVVAIGTSYSHSYALKESGHVVAWGGNQRDFEFRPPEDLSDVIVVDGGNYHTVVLQGTGAPYVTLHPWNRTVPTGLEVTFRVMAVGRAPLQYQWRKDGVVLDGETNSTLTISRVRQNDEGLYDAIVTNAIGTMTSSRARLRVPGNGVHISRVTFGAEDGLCVVFQSEADAYYLVEGTDSWEGDQGWKKLRVIKGIGGMITVDNLQAADASQRFVRVQRVY